MGWLGFLIAGICILIGCCLVEACDLEEILQGILFGIIMFAPIYLLTLLLVCAIPTEFDVTKAEEREIYQINIGDKAEGSYLILVGNINSKSVYNYYYKDNIGIQRDYLYSSRSIIIEEENCVKPRVVVYKEKKTKEPMKFSKYFFGKKLSENLRYYVTDREGIIYLPSGTLIPYKFDGMNL